MCRKITLAAVCLFVFMLSGAEASADIEQAKSNIISLIKAGDYAQAKVQTEELIADFSSNPDLSAVIYKIAEEFRRSTRPDKEKYEYARIFYQQVIQSYPDSAYADKAALGISRGKVLYLIISQDFDAAWQALEEMVTNFASHPDLPEELYGIAKGYGYWERHKEERNVYQQIIQNYPDSEYAERARLGFARANVQSLIMSQDYDGAEDALDELVADFSGDPNLQEALYWIAERYIWLNRLEDAKSVYQQIMQNYPDDPLTEKSRSGLPRPDVRLGLPRADVLSLIMSQDYEGADEALDKMITDFSGNPGLPETVLSIGQWCYDKGLSEENEGLTTQSRGRFEKVTEIWEKFTSEFPDYSPTPNAYCWTGDCYLKLGEHQDSLRCFQKVVDDYPEYEYAWQAQDSIGRCYKELKYIGAVEESVADAQIEAAYEQLLEKYPDCPVAELARHWLLQKAGTEKEE